MRKKLPVVANLFSCRRLDGCQFGQAVGQGRPLFNGKGETGDFGIGRKLFFIFARNAFPTLFHTAAATKATAVIGAVKAGETVGAGMFFHKRRDHLRNIDFAATVWQGVKGHLLLLHSLVIQKTRKFLFLEKSPFEKKTTGLYGIFSGISVHAFKKAADRLRFHPAAALQVRAGQHSRFSLPDYSAKDSGRRDLQPRNGQIAPILSFADRSLQAGQYDLAPAVFDDIEMRLLNPKVGYLQLSVK